MKIYIAADHGGFELKQNLLRDLKVQNKEIVDLGAQNFDAGDDYPHFAFAVANSVVNEGGDNAGIFGILICRSGIGMSIAANKVDGAYAALCMTAEHARKAREHNDANILVLDADYNHDEPLTIVTSFLETKFAAGRHERRVEQIKQYELNRSGEPT